MKGYWSDRAIGSDQDQKYVMIVQPDGLTKYQRVELGPIVDGLRVVRSGLKGNETVIVEGIGKVRPNLKVNAKQTDMNKYATDQLAMETHIGLRSWLTRWQPRSRSRSTGWRTCCTCLRR